MENTLNYDYIVFYTLISILFSFIIAEPDDKLSFYVACRFVHFIIPQSHQTRSSEWAQTVCELAEHSTNYLNWLGRPELVISIDSALILLLVKSDYNIVETMKVVLLTLNVKY